MRLLDYLIYRLRPFGLVEQRPATPEPPPDLELTATPWFVPNETVTLNASISNTTNVINFTSTTIGPIESENITNARYIQTNAKDANYTYTNIDSQTIKSNLTATVTDGSIILTNHTISSDLHQVNHTVNLIVHEDLNKTASKNNSVVTPKNRSDVSNQISI